MLIIHPKRGNAGNSNRTDGENREDINAMFFV